MIIRKTRPEELDLLMKMYDNARLFMAGHGNPSQWGQNYPKRTLIASDIESGCSYVCEEHGENHCHFFLQRRRG